MRAALQPLRDMDDAALRRWFGRFITQYRSVRQNLGELQQSYKPEYLKYFTRGKAEVMKQAELLGGSQTEKSQRFLGDFDRFERLRGQDAMDATFYYLRSTFTDVATKKVDSLRLNRSMTPSQFEQRLEDLTEVTNREIARRNYLLKNGFVTEEVARGIDCIDSEVA